MYKPYIVSADIYLLMEKWATRHDFVLSEKEFFSKLREEFSDYMRRIFPDFELVSEEEISLGLIELVEKSGLPVISLDHVYFQSKLNFEIARLADEYGNDRGLGRRGNTLPLIKQVRKLKMSGVREAVLVDDVVFSGALIERVVEVLSKIGISVPLIIAGIGINEGINRINGSREIRCVHTYNSVIDEVCERDFYPGVPLSGRLLIGNDNIGIPYILPFGKPDGWASIPSDQTKNFSRFCIQQTITLFDEIAESSGKPVLCQDLGRKVLRLPTDSTPYTDVLRKIL
ncbi:hypothetical protein CO057_03970 [Candidatus Uhrbacteria bacterium CG_4_9_14_0_2_um_filter_41_50]|uniref:Phosphoribosyltransferase domain-containing protein n=1 Tax=Candidatus Uhrbacteria bacterium CG_4_9_14_0_2_um_filter_41_50 TaxID=1975031 RepID=A0A2M8ENB2_9BACT|nr:MAG: hypothetical protein COZ45_01510 [Candidatus Uhrbacteria bacterium CG_4_10_14_3_um_filter_41_21]PJB84524.1 MAG: hypothetical protein CO086_03155 [Candidatus Uhrbacteria bacterium CG_4_9_14_0_8_um_filter_41_16]PJC24225.1 MAG: hypothetical protein CO057_03970 [Candidatus Uhrbacteria bacterium CG_4_9_14_0_2_um_filter_41_50]